MARNDDHRGGSELQQSVQPKSGAHLPRHPVFVSSLPKVEPMHGLHNRNAAERAFADHREARVEIRAEGVGVNEINVRSTCHRRQASGAPKVTAVAFVKQVNRKSTGAGRLCAATFRQAGERSVIAMAFLQALGE